MQAMILAAGRGERMRPLTDVTPKPLLPVGGKPLIEWHIERLAAAGFDDLVINVAHLGRRIVDAVGDGARWGVKIRYSVEPEPLETASGIAHALPLLDAAFAAVSADIYAEIDYRPLAARLERIADVHLMLVPSPQHKIVWTVGLDGERVVPNQPDYTFAGVGLFRRPQFVGIDPFAKRPLREVFDRAIAAGRATAEAYAGYWVDVGTPERLAAVDAHLNSLSSSSL